MPRGVDRQAGGRADRQDVDKDGHICTASSTSHTHGRGAAAVEDAEPKIDSHDNRVLINRYLDEPLGFQVPCDNACP